MFKDKLCTEQMKQTSPIQCIDTDLPEHKGTGAHESGNWVQGPYESFHLTGLVCLAFWTLRVVCVGCRIGSLYGCLVC